MLAFIFAFVVQNRFLVDFGWWGGKVLAGTSWRKGSKVAAAGWWWRKVAGSTWRRVAVAAVAVASKVGAHLAAQTIEQRTHLGRCACLFLVSLLGRFQYYHLQFIPVSYTHLTLPTKA